MCRKKEQDLRRNVNEVNEFNTSDLVNLSPTENDFYVDTIEHDMLSDQAFSQVKICSVPLRMKIDTGAQVNIIPRSVFQPMGRIGPIQPTHKRLTAYNGQPLNVDGFITLPCQYNGQTSNEEFY